MVMLFVSCCLFLIGSPCFLNLEAEHKNNSFKVPFLSHKFQCPIQSRNRICQEQFKEVDEGVLAELPLNIQEVWGGNTFEAQWQI